MGRMSRDKGARFEREVARMFTAAGFDCARVPNSGGLRLKGDLYGDMPVHLEAKHRETWDLPAYLRQAEAECDGKIPVVALRKNHGRAYAVLPLSDLIGLLAQTRETT